MKKILVIFGGIFLFSCNLLLAQRTGTTSTTAVKTISKEDISALPFSKGKWEFTICKPNLGYSHQSIKENGVSQGTQNSFTFNPDINYYVANHIGIGLEVDASLGNYKFNSNKQTYNSWMTYADLTYGTSSNNFSFYARAGIGVGGTMNKYTPATGSSSSDKEDLFGYKLLLGFPLQLQHDRPIYFTPELGYNHLRTKFSGGTETDNRFGLGLKLETFLFCHEMECDEHLGYALSHRSYEPGSSYLGFGTRGSVDFGSLKNDYSNTNFTDSKQNYTQTGLTANYMYYIVPNLALGAGIDFGSSNYKTSGSSAKETHTNFSFMPMLELNMPVQNKGLNNLFVRGGYGFGMQNDKLTNGSTSSTNKLSTTDFCIGLGYNFFFYKGLSFTPIFDYDMSSSKNKNTGNKEKLNGPELGFGVRKFF